MATMRCRGSRGGPRLVRWMLSLALLVGGGVLAPAADGAGAPDVPTPPSVADRQALGAFFDELIPAQLDRRRIPGAVVAVVRAGEPTFTRGYGLADLDRRVPVDPDTTLFHFGSNG